MLELESWSSFLWTLCFNPYCERKDEELGYILRVSDFSCLIYGKGKEEAAIKRGRDHNLQQQEQLRESSCGRAASVRELEGRGELESWRPEGH